jgi:uncharacterized protein with von Willebrand factor type A (vWA) domain
VFDQVGGRICTGLEVSIWKSFRYPNLALRETTLNSDRTDKPRGGILHTYSKYDPIKIPGPSQQQADIVTPMMNQMLSWGSQRSLTDEEMARAIKLDPSQLSQLGPSIDYMKAVLEDQKEKLLQKYETKSVRKKASKAFQKKAKPAPPLGEPLKSAYEEAIQRQQLHELENIWYRINNDADESAKHLMSVIARLQDKYQIDELDGKYNFTGHESLTIPEAIELKQLLDKIEDLLKQLEDAEKNGQLAYLDLDELGDFIEEKDRHSLEDMQRQIQDYIERAAEQQGFEKNNGKYELTPKAYRTFQNKLLSRIFSHLKESNSGRHFDNAVNGEGAVEMQSTKPYEFGDSITNMDVPQTFINAMIRDPGQSPIRLKSDDIEIHRTRNNPKAATVIIMDMSGSMRYDGQYVNVKRMALAMDGLIRSEYPGDYLGFIEMYTFGKVRKQGEIIDLMPKPVTIHHPVVQLKVDMSKEEVSEHMIHPHFTNIQHSLRLARQLLANVNTPNRQVMLITDGLPTAHFEDSELFLLYPPHPKTEEATLREGMMCANEGITINTFLVPSWSQTEEDIRFAYRLSESTTGRVFFTSGGDLDRFVVWDYIKKKREIL